MFHNGFFLKSPRALSKKPIIFFFYPVAVLCCNAHTYVKILFLISYKNDKYSYKNKYLFGTQENIPHYT